MNVWEWILTVGGLILAGIFMVFVAAVSLLPYAAIGVAMFVGMRYLGWI